ncbi:MAG: hypothetical protein ACR2H6_01090 [Pyrinomonadaceae bacterium]
MSQNPYQRRFIWSPTNRPATLPAHIAGGYPRPSSAENGDCQLTINEKKTEM